jgi:hypothetical protein
MVDLLFKGAKMIEQIRVVVFDAETGRHNVEHLRFKQLQRDTIAESEATWVLRSITRFDPRVRPHDATNPGTLQARNAEVFKEVPKWRKQTSIR